MASFIDKLFRSYVLRRASAEADFFMKRKATALRSELHRRAMLEAADFVNSHMPEALMCKDRMQHLSYLSSLIPKDGLLLEFGVYSGETINHIAGLLPQRVIHGFDSFEGLPEAWSGYRFSAENFDLKGRMPKVSANVELVAGWFDKTLPDFLDKHPGPIALLHVDCDIYSSTKTIFELLRPRLVPGSIIAFDEFFNYPAWKLHEFKAFQEFIQTTGITYTYIGYAGEQVSIRIDTV